MYFEKLRKREINEIVLMGNLKTVECMGGKEVVKPTSFSERSFGENSKLGWRKHKLESRLPGEISITSDMQMTPPLWQTVKKN